VEVHASIQAIKYIHKYIYKGSDCATLLLQETTNADEVQQHLQGRYIGPCEAVWTLLEYRVHEEFPPVYHLPVHLYGEQPVFFAEGLTRAELQIQLDQAHSKLMAWFAYNTAQADRLQYLYQDFPTHYVFHDKHERWQKRKRGMAIGCMYHCNPFQDERFYLRLLLTVCRGSTSYVNFRTIHGIEYSTYQQACLALGLLEDDREWIQYFEETVLYTYRIALYTLFATAIMHGGILNPTSLWIKFQQHICADISYQLQHRPAIIPPDLLDPHFDYGLHLLSLILQDAGKTLQDFHLPSVLGTWTEIAHENALITIALIYNIQTE